MTADRAGSAGAGSGGTGSAGPGGASTGKASTRELILDTAERLFAEQGIFATSNRRIAEAAGQGNNWVAGYHFGTKADLVRAITRRFNAEVERSRMEMLAGLDDSAGLAELLGCLVRPWTDRFEALGPNSYFARVCAQAMNSPTLRPIVVEEGSHSDSVAQTWAALDQYLPGGADLSSELRRGMMQHLIVFVCAEREGALAEGRPVSRPTWADEADGIIDALQGIITASVTDLAPSPVRRNPAGKLPAQRLQNVLICGGCQHIDGRGKRKLDCAQRLRSQGATVQNSGSRRDVIGLSAAASDDGGG